MSDDAGRLVPDTNVCRLGDNPGVCHKHHYQVPQPATRTRARPQTTLRDYDLVDVMDGAMTTAAAGSRSAVCERPSTARPFAGGAW